MSIIWSSINLGATKELYFKISVKIDLFTLNPYFAAACSWLKVKIIHITLPSSW